MSRMFGKTGPQRSRNVLNIWSIATFTRHLRSQGLNNAADGLIYAPLIHLVETDTAVNR